MKRVFIALPLVILLTNCNTQRNTTSNDSMGANTTGTTGTIGTDMNTSGTATGTSTGTTGGVTPSASDATGTTGSTGSIISGTTPQGTTGTTGGTTPGYNTGTSAGVSGNTNTGWNQINSPYLRGGTAGTTYDANNYMQNPDKYKTPAQLGAAGGWTYNNDWRINTNFKPEAMGQWQMVATPEVASLWRRDTSRPETYAAYWTPEAVSARRMEQMAMNARRADSIAMLSGTGSGNLGTSRSAGMNANSNNNSNNTTTNRVSGSMNGTTGTNVSGSVDNTMNNNNSTVNTNNQATDVNPNGNVNGSMNGSTGTSVQGSVNGTTGSMSGSATGTMNTSGDVNTTGMNSDSSGMGQTNDIYTAINGNKYMMPRLSLFLDNGTFTGYTGCNNITGKVTVDGNRITFDNPMPATNFGCTGGFDQDGFMDRLRRADSYEVNGEQLYIKQGNEILFVLAKSGDQYSQSGNMKQ